MRVEYRLFCLQKIVYKKDKESQHRIKICDVIKQNELELPNIAKYSKIKGGDLNCLTQSIFYSCLTFVKPPTVPVKK